MSKLYQTVTLRIEPFRLNGENVEPCIVSIRSQTDDYFYPLGHLHIDTFYASPMDFDLSIYEALENGKTVEIELPLTRFTVLDGKEE
jgi:hypothetical protein